MNILLVSLKNGIKSLLFWLIGLFVLMFAGMIKYTGISGAGDMSITEIIDKFPRIVLAMFGMVGVDINTLGGYYAILAFYAMICAAIYAAGLGANAVSREFSDRTYEFLFTKPISRTYALAMKLSAGILQLTVFSIISLLFSFAAIGYLNLPENISMAVILFSLSLFLVGLVFFALAAFASAVSKRAEKGALYGNLAFIIAFIVGVVYEMNDFWLFKLFSPLKYFAPWDLLDGKLDPVYLLITIGLFLIFMFGTFRVFDRKDFVAA